MLTRTVWGHNMFLDGRDVSLAPRILTDGCWEMWVTSFLFSQVRKGQTVLEVGTNIGYYTILFASKVGRSGKVYGFEANPNGFDLTYDSLSFNKLLKQVTLVNKAVYSKSQTLKFTRFKRHQGGSTVLPVTLENARYWHDETDVIEVEAVSIDDYFGDSIPKVDWIKVDAEGSEAHIFDGMQRLIQANPQVKIIFEFAPILIQGTGKTTESLVEFLESQGFNFYLIGESLGLRWLSKEQLLEQQYCEVFACQQ